MTGKAVTSLGALRAKHPPYNLIKQMAGVKGKSGGPRDMKGKSGGARPGAGRKPKAPARSGITDPLDLLLAVARGEVDASATQVRAAIAAVQYIHPKKGEGGKRANEADAAKRQAGVGRFQPSPPPLALVPSKRQSGGDKE